MELPAPLIPWRERLELLEPAAALALGPLLQRLDLAVGPFRTHGHHGDGDPDGFNGIARRGSYERLLISEWLLADELPEEFTRRALTGEHAFLQLARRAPAGEQRCIVLFDAGPDQWGAPRLAHLAALLVMERRARAAGVTFQWGILQDEDHRLNPAGNEAGIKRLLTMRSGVPVQAGQFSAWSRALAVPTATRQEIWLVGGQQAVSLAGPETCGLRITEPLEPGLAQLDAEVFRPGSGTRTVVLPLPDDPTCVRLLRDPFGSAVTTPQRSNKQLVPASNLIFSTSGNKLFARSHDGALIAYPIPNSPQAGVGKPRVLRPRMPGVIVAAGRTRKVTVALLLDQVAERLHLECLASSHARIPSGPVTIEVGLAWALDSELALGELIGVWGEVEPELFGHVQGALLRITRTSSYQNTAEVMDLIEGVTPTTRGIAYVSRGGDDWLKTAYSPGNKRGTELVRPHAGQRVCGGYGGSISDASWGLCGLEMKSGSWSVEAGDAIWQLHPPQGTEVIGVTGPMKYGESPGIVVLEADRTRISVLGLNWSHRLPPASAEIEHATVSPVAAHIAYATVQGEVVVYSLAHAAVLYRLTPAGVES